MAKIPTKRVVQKAPLPTAPTPPQVTAETPAEAPVAASTAEAMQSYKPAATVQQEPAEAPQAPVKTVAKITVIAPYPYPMVVPRQQVRIQPGVPIELDDTPWVRSQIAGGTLKIVREL